MTKNPKLNLDSRLLRRSLLQITTTGVLASTLGTATVGGQSQPEVTVPEVNVDARIWGDSFRTPANLVVIAENPRLTDSYNYESYSGEQEIEQAPTGLQFAFIDLTVRNEAGETRQTPYEGDFQLVANQEQVEPIGTEYEADDRYDGYNNVLSGVVDDGVLPYLISAEASINDLRLFYEDYTSLDDVSEDINVTWQSGSIGNNTRFAFTDGSAPLQTPLSETYQVSSTIKNFGTEAGTQDIKYKIIDSFGQALVERKKSLTLSSGDSGSVSFEINSELVSNTDDLIHVFITNDDKITGETAANPDLNWGVSYRTPTDLIVTAENPRLTDSYTYGSYSGEQETEQAPAGQQFAFVDLSVKNDDFETRETPYEDDFQLVANQEQVEPIGTEYEADDRYDGYNNVLSGVVDDGVLPYLISAEASINDLKLFYDGTDLEVTWESIDAPDVAIVGQTLDPPEINTDSSRTHTLSFDALNISTDGGQDDFTVELPDKVEVLEVTDVTVTRGSADAESDVEHSFADNTIKFSVNFETSQRVQDMSFDVLMNLIASDTASDR
jgi:hypothetical protein